MRKGFLPSMPETPEKIPKMATDILCDYWNRSKDILSHRDSLICCKEISESTGENEDAREIINFLEEEKIIYQLRTGMELSASPELVLTPLGLCFLSCYENNKPTAIFEDTYCAAEKMLSETYNISAIERLSDVVEESKKLPNEKETILAFLVIFSQATTEKRALKLEKVSTPIAGNMYKHQEALLKATELLSRIILGAKSNVFRNIGDFDNTVRNPKRLIYKTHGFFVRESLEKEEGYRFYFKLTDKLENLNVLIARILGKIDANRKKKIVEFLEEYMRDQGLLFRRAVRGELLNSPNIELRYLQNLRSIVGGL